MSTIKSFKDWVLTNLKPELPDTLEDRNREYDIKTVDELQELTDFIKKHLQANEKDIVVYEPPVYKTWEYTFYPPFRRKTASNVLEYLKTLEKIDSIKINEHDMGIAIAEYHKDINFESKPRIISVYNDSYELPLSIYMSIEDLFKEDILSPMYPGLFRAINKDPINGFKEWSRVNDKFKKYF